MVRPHICFRYAEQRPAKAYHHLVIPKAQRRWWHKLGWFMPTLPLAFCSKCNEPLHALDQRYY